MNSPSFSAKASLDGFQWIELASGEVATPASPMPPARESTEIMRKGTAVVMVLSTPASQSWPVSWLMHPVFTWASKEPPEVAKPRRKRFRRTNDRVIGRGLREKDGEYTGLPRGLLCVSAGSPASRTSRPAHLPGWKRGGDRHRHHGPTCRRNHPNRSTPWPRCGSRRR